MVKELDEIPENEMSIITSLLEEGFICLETDFEFEFYDDLLGCTMILYGKRGDWLNITDKQVLRLIR
jgi:hypothetical protein